MPGVLDEASTKLGPFLLWPHFQDTCRSRHSPVSATSLGVMTLFPAPTWPSPSTPPHSSGPKL